MAGLAPASDDLRRSNGACRSDQVGGDDDGVVMVPVERLEEAARQVLEKVRRAASASIPFAAPD
jgi:hypothetical protein